MLPALITLGEWIKCILNMFTARIHLHRGAAGSVEERGPFLPEIERANAQLITATRSFDLAARCMKENSEQSVHLHNDTL